MTTSIRSRDDSTKYASDGIGIMNQMTRNNSTSPGADIVTVPATAKELTPLSAEDVGTRNEIEDMLDDLFGPDGDDVHAGKFDIGLVVVGIALIVLYVVGFVGSVVGALGVILIALGLILPARAVVRRFKERRTEERVAEVFRTRTALNIGEPVTADLAAAYARALELRAVPLGHDVAEAAHAAVVEVAHALRGRVPGTDSEIEYVRERTSTIDQLVDKLRDRQRRSDEESAIEVIAARERDVLAIREVEETAGDSALTRLQALGLALDEIPPQ